MGAVTSCGGHHVRRSPRAAVTTCGGHHVRRSPRAAVATCAYLQRSIPKLAGSIHAIHANHSIACKLEARFLLDTVSTSCITCLLCTARARIRRETFNSVNDSRAMFDSDNDDDNGDDDSGDDGDLSSPDGADGHAPGAPIELLDVSQPHGGCLNGWFARSSCCVDAAMWGCSGLAHLAE
jgi:hypothetical protein